MDQLFLKVTLFFHLFKAVMGINCLGGSKTEVPKGPHCEALQESNGIVCYRNDKKDGIYATVTCYNNFRLERLQNTTVCINTKHGRVWTLPVPKCVPIDDSNNGSESVIGIDVTIPIVILTAIAAVVAFLLWRRRRQKSSQIMKSKPEISITNISHEEHGLERHIGFPNLNMQTTYNDSADGSYSEITSPQDELTGNVYQTIDSLPSEDPPESSTGYGHLKVQTTNFIDKNYSHFSINQTNVNVIRDTTYAHIKNATNEQVVNDNRVDDDNTYNRLQSTPKTNSGNNKPETHEEGFDDMDVEYSHAKAGLPDLAPESQTETYSHLNNSLQKSQVHP